jgi:4'-phosphopantetheinyl transferase
MRSVADGGARISTHGARQRTVDVWRAPLALPPAELFRVSVSLDDEERERAARFRFPHDRDRFLASRGLLRNILASYLKMPAGRIRFGYAPQGKPFLPDYRDLRFNLSHAGNVLVVGVATGREIGIDVEQVFSEAVMNEVSGPVLSESERAVFRQLDPGERRDWFVRLWTRKEAYIKADGRGMSLPLDGIDVMTRPGRVRIHGAGPGDLLLSDRWAVQELAVPSGYTAALVSEERDCRVAYFDWPPHS